MTFIEKLDAAVSKNNSLVCVGLDQGTHEFDKIILDATNQYVCVYKLNFAFYEANGVNGWSDLKKTVEYLKKNHPQIPLIADAKRGDIGSTNQAYAKAIFDELGFDAVTVNPYVGREGLQPFLDRADNGIIILCKTSNPGSGEFQDLSTGSRQALWQKVAENVVRDWNKNHNCLLVVGATYPEELAQVRKIVGDMTLLVPGIGAQGGEVEATVKAGLNSKKAGIIINSSRGIIFADNPGLAAKTLRDTINQNR